MSNTIKILHLEDLDTDAELVQRTLKKANAYYDFCVVDTKTEFVEALDDYKPDVILSDHSLPTFNSIEALRILQEKKINIPFILVTATVSEEFAVQALQSGATDYVLKDRMQRLPSAVLHALEIKKLEAERRAFHEELVRRDILMRDAEKLAHFGSWQVDVENNIAKFSDEALLIHGFSTNDIVGKLDDFLMNVYPNDLRKITNQINKSLAGEQKHLKLSYRIPGRKGKDKFVISELLFQRNDAGKVLSIVGFSQDITERKKEQDEIILLKEQKKEEAVTRKNLQQISNFVHHASHELRTPLATMLLQTESALNKELQAAESKRILESLKEDIVKLIELTNSLLMLSQFDSDVQKKKWPEQRIDELLYKAIDESKNNFPAMHIHLNVNVMDGDEDKLVMAGNEMLLVTAFCNLIKNAHQYSDDDSISILLEIKDNILYIHFDNNGAVINTGEIEKIFLPLVRGENAHRKTGYGLGLSIVKKIVELHNGTIRYGFTESFINRFTIQFRQ